MSVRFQWYASVMLFKRYLGKRPSEKKKSGLFYPSVIDKPVSSVWYKKTLMEKNTINTIMKNMKKNSPLKDLCPKKSLTNHSARKTVVLKEVEKFWYPEVWDKEYHRPRICQRAWRLRLRRRKGAADHFTSHWQHWSCSFKRRFKSTLFCKFHCILVCSRPNFSQCSVTLNIAGNDAVQKSTSDIRRE